jgi:hypothetical protein
LRSKAAPGLFRVPSVAAKTLPNRSIARGPGSRWVAVARFRSHLHRCHPWNKSARIPRSPFVCFVSFVVHVLLPGRLVCVPWLLRRPAVVTGHCHAVRRSRCRLRRLKSALRVAAEHSARLSSLAQQAGGGFSGQWIGQVENLSYFSPMRVFRVIRGPELLRLSSDSSFEILSSLVIRH